MLYIICYDITSNSRRRKVADLLLDQGDRIQLSAFECQLASDKELNRLLDRIRSTIDLRTDSVRLYRICGSCLAQKIRLGVQTNESTKLWQVG